MAKAIGAVLGLASLLYTILVILNGWADFSQSVKIYVLIVPSIFATIALAVALSISRIWGGRLYRRLRGTQDTNEFAFLDSKGWEWIIVPLWIFVGVALYHGAEQCCG